MKGKKTIRVDYWIAAMLIMAMALIAFVNVLSRYFVNFSIGATEEITINLFVWMTVVGTGIARSIVRCRFCSSFSDWRTNQTLW